MTELLRAQGLGAHGPFFKPEGKQKPRAALLAVGRMVVSVDGCGDRAKPPFINISAPFPASGQGLCDSWEFAKKKWPFFFFFKGIQVRLVQGETFG